MTLFPLCIDDGDYWEPYNRPNHARRRDGQLLTNGSAVRLYSTNMNQPEKPTMVNDLIKSRDRVADHGEVFTPDWVVEDMLSLVKDESERIDSRFLEPACGAGNFLAPILQRKLTSATRKYQGRDFDIECYSLLGLMCCYGIELLEDNVNECRNRLHSLFVSQLGLDSDSPTALAARAVVDANIVHGDALSMKQANGQPIEFAEWGYLGKGRFQRRDFRLDVLVQASDFSAEGSLFAELGKQEVFVPVRSFPPMSISDIGSPSST
jgi:hypothetical protein